MAHESKSTRRHKISNVSNCILQIFGPTEQKLVPVSHDGISGAQIFRVVGSSGASYIIKKTVFQDDWVRGVTHDRFCREAIISSLPFLKGKFSPTLEYRTNGDQCCIVMEDLSDSLPQNSVWSHQVATAISRGLASLHDTSVPNDPGLPWCPLDLRVRMTLIPPLGFLGPHAPHHIIRDINLGWRIFSELAPQNMISRLLSFVKDSELLSREIEEYGLSVLHGDLKPSNICVSKSDNLFLLDWSMSCLGPPSLDLGLLIGSSAPNLPMSIDKFLDDYISQREIRHARADKLKASAVIFSALTQGWKIGLRNRINKDSAELKWLWPSLGRALSEFS